jgi:hypothetical protein
MNLKAIAAATLAFAATGSYATAIFPTGPDDSTHIGDSFKLALPATSDVFTFTVNVASFFNGSLTSTAAGTTLDYDFKSITLDGPGAYDFVYLPGGIDKSETVDIYDTLLIPGSYTFTVSGKTDGSKGGSWGGDLNLVAAVAEPDTTTLLLGGIGALGFLGSRRRSS